MNLPQDIAYIDQTTDLNHYIFGNLENTRSSVAWTSFHCFPVTDIAGTILPILQKQAEDGKKVFVMPEVLQNLTDYNAFDGVVPSMFFHDLRSK